MDIHNTSWVCWGAMNPSTKKEIRLQEKLGAQLQYATIDCRTIWFDFNLNSRGTMFNSTRYRIKPGTEIREKTTRPADEMDIHSLTRIYGEWHPETRSEMLAWKHGWEFAGQDGWRSIEHKTPSWSFGTCYRAKRAQLNLIERTASRDNAEIAALHEALVQADKIIKSLGSIVNTDAYKNAIK